MAERGPHNGRYVLRGHEHVPCEDLIEWARWWEGADRHVAQDTVEGAKVSTVFLGIDHSFGYGPPLLFETMVFGGPLSDEQDRCETWEQAEAMHARMVERVKTAWSPVTPSAGGSQ